MVFLQSERGNHTGAVRNTGRKPYFFKVPSKDGISFWETHAFDRTSVMQELKVGESTFAKAL